MFIVWQKLTESVNIVWYELWKNQYWEDSPACIYLLKVNNRNSETICEICSKLTIKKPERRHWRRSGVFIVDFEHMSHLALMFLFLIWTCNCRLVVTLRKCQYHWYKPWKKVLTYCLHLPPVSTKIRLQIRSVYIKVM